MIGKEFPLALIERVAAADGEDLQRMLASLQLAEFIHELPAFPDAAYVFKHALTQEVAYGSVLAERRKALHHRIGEAIEATFANQLDDYVEDLARHYSRGSDAKKAAPYFYLAGQKVAARSAYADAMAYFTSGLEMLPAIAGGPQRDQLELGLQLSLEQSLMFAKGYSSPDVQGAFGCSAGGRHHRPNARSLSRTRPGRRGAAEYLRIRRIVRARGHEHVTRSYRALRLGMIDYGIFWAVRAA